MRRLLGTVVLVAVAGCSSGLELSVDLRTDLAPGDEFVLATAVLEARAPTVSPTSMGEAGATRAMDYFTGRRIAELAPGRSGDYLLTVELFDAAGGVVARRVVSVHVAANLAVTVVVTRDCRGVTCPGPADAPSFSTCSGGRCVDPRCIAGTDPATCGMPECHADGDCPALAACADAQCFAGICLYEAHDDRCTASEECRVDVGCTPLMSVDAGAVDAGTHGDAGGCVPDCGLRTCGPELVCGASCGADCGAGATCMFGGCIPASSFTLCVDGDVGHCSGTDEMWMPPQCCVSNVVSCVYGDATACIDPGYHWTGAQCCTPPATICAPGLAGHCTDGSEHWTGMYCCVSGSPICPSGGDETTCGNIGGHWTGNNCCVTGMGSCELGNAVDCSDPQEHWTGTYCCVDAPAVCAPGTAADCTDFVEHWTGSMCCITGGLFCTPSDAASCTGAGQHFTGTQCCT